MMKFTDSCIIEDEFKFADYNDPTKTKEGCRVKFDNKLYFDGFRGITLEEMKRVVKTLGGDESKLLGELRNLVQKNG